MGARARRRLKKNPPVTVEQLFPMRFKMEQAAGIRPGEDEREELMISFGASFALGFGVLLGEKALGQVADLIIGELRKRNYYGEIVFVRSSSGDISIRGQEEATLQVNSKTQVFEGQRHQLT